MMGQKRKVIGTNADGVDITFDSFAQAGREVGITSTLIRLCALGEKPTAGNMVWRMEGVEFDIDDLNKLKPTSAKFLDEAMRIHGDKYEHIELPRIWHSSIQIYCNTCKLPFIQIANNHISGNGCPRCASSGFKGYLPAVLYYLQVDYLGDTAYKIGVTNRTVVERFSRNTKGHITVLKEWSYSKGSDALDRETEILQNFKIYKWQGKDLLSDGNSELFDRNILEVGRVHE